MSEINRNTECSKCVKEVGLYLLCKNSFNIFKYSSIQGEMNIELPGSISVSEKASLQLNA